MVNNQISESMKPRLEVREARHNVMGSSQLVFRMISKGAGEKSVRATFVGNVEFSTFGEQHSDALFSFDVPIRVGSEAKDGRADQTEPFFILDTEVNIWLGLGVLEEV